MPLFLPNPEAAVYRGNQYLISTRSEQEEHAGGTIGFTGGGIDPVDHAEHDVVRATLRREVMEEINVTVGQMDYVRSTVVEFPDVTVLFMLFLCEYESGEPRAIDPAEVSAVAWMTAEEILAHPKCPPWLPPNVEACEKLRLIKVKE